MPSGRYTPKPCPFRRCQQPIPPTRGRLDLSTDQPRSPIPGLVEAKTYFRLGSCGPVPTEIQGHAPQGGPSRVRTETRGETDLFYNLTGATSFTILEHIQDRSVLSVDPLRPDLFRAQREAQTEPRSPPKPVRVTRYPRHSAIILCACLFRRSCPPTPSPLTDRS